MDGMNAARVEAYSIIQWELRFASNLCTHFLYLNKHSMVGPIPVRGSTQWFVGEFVVQVRRIFI